MYNFNFDILDALLKEWTMFAIVALISFFVLKIFKAIVLNKLESLATKTKTQIDDMFVEAINSIRLPFYFFTSIYIATFFIKIDYSISKIISHLFLISLIFYVIKFLERVVDYGVEKITANKDKKDNEGIIRLGGNIIKIVLWFGAIISVLSNLGYNVTSLITGLGIGGVAVALALQSILGDLFGSLTIMMDKPFKIGDFIVIDDQSGTVRRIGIRSTRIELLQGEELIIPNNELVKSRVRNYGRMKKRRVTFDLGIVYGTPAPLLEKIPKIIKKIIESEPNTEFVISSFNKFGDFSLNFRTVYYVNTGDNNENLKILEQINLKIVREFEKEKIEMAFPTQTLYIQK